MPSRSKRVVSAEGNNVSYTNSKTWVSPQSKEQEKFALWMNCVDRICPKSPVVPTKLADWLSHRQAMKEAQVRQAGARLKSKQETRNHPRIETAFGRKGGFTQDRGFVLAEKTIWCPNWAQKEQKAAWPDIAELRWEGDDRAKTKVGRFIPLPRQKPNNLIPWYDCKPVQSYKFDEVRKVPTMEDVIAPVDEIEEDDIPTLLGEAILEGLDSDTIY